MNTRPSDLLGPPPTVQGVKETGLDVPEVQKAFFYYFVITLYLIAILFSLVVNSLLFFAFMKAIKLFLQRPFLLMVLQIVFANLFSIISNLICGVPITILLDDGSTKDYLASVIYTLFNALDTLSTWVLQICSLLLAFHRFLIFILPRHSNIFSGIALLIIIISTWSLSLVVTVVVTAKDCFFKAVNISGLLYRFHYFCGETENSEAFTGAMFGVDMVGSVGLPLVSLFLYVIIFIKLLAVRKETGATSYGEKEMLKQAVAIFILYQLSNGIILIVHTTNTNASLAFLSKRINSTTWILAGALAPLCLIITSKEIRKLLFGWKRSRKEQRTSQPPPTISATGGQVQMRHSSHF